MWATHMRVECAITVESVVAGKRGGGCSALNLLKDSCLCDCHTL